MLGLCSQISYLISLVSGTIFDVFQELAQKVEESCIFVNYRLKQLQKSQSSPYS
jgi:hypothetical protein